MSTSFRVRSFFAVLLLAPWFVSGPGGALRAGEQQRSTPAPAESALTGVAAVRANYTKFEYRIPMRDGVRLFTAVYVPKDAFTDGRTYPIMLTRTPYAIGAYGIGQYRSSLGPSLLFQREKFIFAYQDVRGRYMSEGEFVLTRPYKPVKNGPKDTDESTDTYDTIDWLVKHVPDNTGKVGLWGISQPGFFATAGMLDAHPALVAVSPQAPVTDYYFGDDVYHNGAFMLAHRFGFFVDFRPRLGPPTPPQPELRFHYPSPDGYQFLLDLGTLTQIGQKYFPGDQFWSFNADHPNYDEVWQSRSIWKYLKQIKPAVMEVGGYFDQEDPQGVLRQFYFMEQHTPPALMLVMGPWNHGGFSRGKGDSLGHLNFGSNTSEYYRENIELPFFLYYLKGKGDGHFPKAWMFQTGEGHWRKFDAWPPPNAKPTALYLDANGTLTWQQPTQTGTSEYVSDPDRPVPYVNRITEDVLSTYMTEDQRFASERPDVLVYTSDVLDHDVTVLGPISVDLKVSTSGTDSDFDVKVIDVYPDAAPDYNNAPESGQPPASAAVEVPMGGYQQLVRGEPFRGRFRHGFEKPVPFEPGKADRIKFELPDVDHTFRVGHRIMIQIQSSWFPLTDRNPQKFVEIPKAMPADFVKATERVYCGGADGSKITLRIEP